MVDYSNQADAAVADLPNVGSVTGSELLYADNGSADVSITTDQIKAYAKAGLAAGDVAGLAAVATSGAASDVSGLADAAASAADTEIAGKAVRFDAAQALTAPQQAQARDNIALAAIAASGAYSDLSGAPNITSIADSEIAAKAVRFDAAQSLTSGQKAQALSNLSLATVASSGAYSDLSGTPALATVATSGAYSDLSGTPTLGTAAALNAGTAPFNAVQLDSAGKLPAVDGSQLTNLPSGGSGNLSNLVYDVTANGVNADGVRKGDGAITTGTNAFSSASASFTSADVGKTIAVIGAGASGATLTTTIAGFTDATHVTLTANAGTTVTGAEFFYGTDNSSAINSLISTVKGYGGGKIFFPSGLYLFGSRLDLSSCQNVVLSGPNRIRNRYYSDANAGLVYTGSVTQPILLGSATGCTIENLWLNYSNSGFTGDYVYIGNTVALDACYNVVRGCLFYTLSSSRNNVGCWVRLFKAVCNQVYDNTFVGGTVCINMVLAAGEYVNQQTIADNLFAQYTSLAIQGGVQAGSVVRNTFESRSDGQGVAFQNSSTAPIQGMNWSDNWFGDVTNGVGNGWLYVCGSGFNFRNNFVAANSGSVGIFLNAVHGFCIEGNYFTAFANVITYNTATCKGGVVQGNFASSYTNFETLTGNKDATCVTQYNSL